MSVLVSREAPDFTTSAVLGNGSIVDQFNLKKTLENKYGLLFFYPLDFTFVCPSELVALDHSIAQFESRNVEVIAVSIDSQFTHNAWRKTPVNNGGIGPVKYTLAADVSHKICNSYGIEHPEAGVSLRGAFIIDKKGIVRSQIINDLPLGRGIKEILRIIDALQFTEKYGQVCPANWEKGDVGMQASPDGVSKYLSENSGSL